MGTGVGVGVCAALALSVAAARADPPAEASPCPDADAAAGAPAEAFPLPAPRKGFYARISGGARHFYGWHYLTPLARCPGCGADTFEGTLVGLGPAGTVEGAVGISGRRGRLGLRGGAMILPRWSAVGGGGNAGLVPEPLVIGTFG